MDDREKLQKEIEYYTRLIESNSQSSTQSLNRPTSHHWTHRPARRPASHSRFTLVRDHSNKARTVQPPKTTQSNRTEVTNSKRTVVPCGGSDESGARRVVVTGGATNSAGESKRTVIKPSASSADTSLSYKIQEPAAQALRLSSTGKASSGSRTVVRNPAVSSAGASSSANETHKRDNTIPAKSKFVWVNKNILSKQYPPSSVPVNSDNGNAVQIRQSATKSQDHTLKSDYKLVRGLMTSESGTTANADKKIVSRYKLIKQDVAKRRSAANQDKTKVCRSGYTPNLSKSGKRLISRYKITRQSGERRKLRSRRSFDVGASPALRMKGKHKTSPFKLDRRTGVTLRSKYKIDKLCNSRKPSKQITPLKSRRHSDRKSLKWVRSGLKIKSSSFMSPYKLIRTTGFMDMSTTNRPSKRRDKSSSVRRFASRSLHKSAITSLRAKYKKDNTGDKHCMFYMRYGKCSRGRTCKYKHDPDRIAICTRYLRGTCNIESCPFSHDPKKEKVPVCQHFMRGCCLRDNCPYLHVNVGRDAPVCKLFAEYRYCHLGEKCKKLHTDICPNRSEDGSCPKGKSCRLRHPKRIQRKRHRPLHAPPAEFGSTGRDDGQSMSDDDLIVLPSKEKLSEALPAYIKLSDGSHSRPGPSKSAVSGAETTHSNKKLKNKPNFL